MYLIAETFRIIFNPATIMLHIGNIWSFKKHAIGFVLFFPLAIMMAHPHGALAQSREMIRIGVTQIGSHNALDDDQKGFESALASSGFQEGVNIIFDRQNAEGDAARADAIARKFVTDGVDLIHCISTPSAQAIMKATRKIPVVFSSITDPVLAGIVPRDSAFGKRTGTNVTGVSDSWPVSLQIQTYSRFVPAVKKWGTIYNPSEPNSMSHIKIMRDTALHLGLELIEAVVSNSDQVADAALSLVGRVQAIVVTSDNTSVANLDAIVRVCNQQKIALFAGDVDSVSRGAIAAYGLDYFLVGYSAGKKAALILKGVEPGDIPWGPVEKFSFVINAQAAKKQGVDIPIHLLNKANKVIH